MLGRAEEVAAQDAARRVGMEMALFVGRFSFATIVDKHEWIKKDSASHMNTSTEMLVHYCGELVDMIVKKGLMKIPEDGWYHDTSEISFEIRQLSARYSEGLSLRALFDADKQEPALLVVPLDAPCVFELQYEQPATAAELGAYTPAELLALAGGSAKPAVAQHSLLLPVAVGGVLLLSADALRQRVYKLHAHAANCMTDAKRVALAPERLAAREGPKVLIVRRFTEDPHGSPPMFRARKEA